MRNDQAYQPDDPLLDQTQIIAYLQISRTQFWRVRGSGDFPKPLQLSQGVSRWRQSQLLEWLRRKEQS
jgi:predicted DNA-binding transcriptional regulator AlpA